MPQPPPRAPIGANLARLRRNRFLTQESLAEKAGVSVDLIKKLEQGQRHTARLTTLENLAEALTVAVSELTQTTTRSETGIRQPSKPRPISATIDTMNAEDLAEIRRVVANLVALDTAHGSTGLDTVATRAFTDARTRLASAQCPEDLAVELADAVAELGQVRAWLLHDAGRDTEARAALAESLVIANTARLGPRRAQLMIVDQLSMIAEWTGACAEALRLAERGYALIERPSPRIEALYRIRRGRAMTTGGNPAGLAELSRAATLLDEGIRDDDPPCAWWVNPAEVTIHHALAASAVGEHRLAVDLAYQAVAKLDSRQRRDAVTYRVALLSVAANAHAWSDVTEIASPLVATLPMAGSARGANVLRAVATNLPSDASNTVTDSIHAMLTAAGDTLSS